ncbi:MAG: hypothetical protein WCI05_00820 [Myxococcales bacterium]
MGSNIDLPVVRTARSRRWSSLAYAASVLAPLAFLLIAGVARRWMSDDGFINLRVVRNILDGYGPVFNVGERVECVTSPLWIALLTLAGATRLPLEPCATWLGIALGVGGAVAATRAALDLAAAPRELRQALANGIVPLGASVFVVLPPVWDFLSSGLENGLSYFWIGVTSAATSRLARLSDDFPLHVTRRAPLLRAAVVTGLGPLVRPDLALAALLFLAVLLAIAMRGREQKGRRTIAVAVVATAAAAPLTYQVFRMGYYALVSPNTALAKEAFESRWAQGGAYLYNFVGTYVLAVPFAVVLVVTLLALWRGLRERRSMSALAAAAPFTAGVATVLYVVRVGGDFMHGRMLLPGTFLVLVAVWVVPVRHEGERVAVALLRIAGVVVVLGWAGICAALLRVPEANQNNIGDERRWYVSQSQVANPVTLEDYRSFYFYAEGQTLRTMAKALCPKGETHCRRSLFIDQPEFGRLWPEVSERPLAQSSVAPGTVMVGARVAVGLMGYMLGPEVHLVDRAGLADPVASRLVLQRRGRPGHEKGLPNAWLVARFTDPAAHEDSRVSAARRALRCGALRDLEPAVRGPLGPARFLGNVVRAWEFGSLRIPTDPWEAEERFCGVHGPDLTLRGGSGGDRFQLECRDGVAALGVMRSSKQTVARLEVECRSLAVAKVGSHDQGQVVRLVCNDGEVPVGLHGKAGDLLDTVGLLCASSGNAQPSPTEAIGGSGGTPWRLACPVGATLVGVAGRAGDLIDAVGPMCAAVP